MQRNTLFVFDFDGVLYDCLRENLFPMSSTVIQYICKNNLGKIALASKRIQGTCGEKQMCDCLKEANVYHLFDAIELGNHNKSIHMHNILKKLGTRGERENIRFFDDGYLNLSEVQTVFPHCQTVWVSPQIGIQLQDIMKEKRMKRKSWWCDLFS